MANELSLRDRSYWFTEVDDDVAVDVITTREFNYYELVVSVGTKAITIPRSRSNAGFNGILVSLVLEDGTRVSQVSAGNFRPAQ